MLLSGNVNQNKGTQEGTAKIAKRYIWWLPFWPAFDFMFGLVGQTKGAAVRLHPTQQLNEMEPRSRYIVEYGECLWAWHMNETKSTWNKKMCVEWLHERHARIRKTVAVTFLISPAFSYFFRFTWSGNQGGQHMCPSYGNADRMAGTDEYYDKFGHHRTRSYTKSTTNGEEEEQYIFRKKKLF